MRYLLYANDQLFYDSENSLINDAIAEPRLHLELSKAGTLEFKIHPTHSMYNSFTRMTTYIRVMQDDEEIFRGRVLEIEDDTYMERKIQCEGDLSYFCDTYQPPDKVKSKTAKTDITTNNSTQRQGIESQLPAESMTIAQVDLTGETSYHETVAQHLTRYLVAHNAQVNSERQFVIGNVTIDEANVEYDFTSAEYRDTKSAMDDLTDQFGGYFQTRRDGSYVYLDYLKEPETTSEQPIMLGINLVDLQKKASCENLFTVLVPIGDNQLTIASVNNGSMYLENDAGVQQYGRIYKVESFSGYTDATKLKTAATSFMAANYKSNPVGFTIKAIDLNMMDGNIDKIRIGTYVNVESAPHGISTVLCCTSIEYDIQSPENNSYDIGDPTEELSKKYQKDNMKSESKASKRSSGIGGLEQAIDRHAENIKDIADKAYTLEADTIKINGRVIEIGSDVTDLLTLTGRTISINASNQITVTTDYMSVTADMSVSGNTTMQGTLDVGGVLGVDIISVGGNYAITGGGIGVSVSGSSYDPVGTVCAFNIVKYNSVSGNYEDVATEDYVENSVIGFGTASASGGSISIPFYTYANPSTNPLAGNTINFNIADTAYYQSHIGIASVGDWAWDSDETKYICVVTANDGSAVDVDLPIITVKTDLGTGSSFNPYAYGPGTTQHIVSSPSAYYLKLTGSYAYVTKNNETPTVGTNVVARVSNSYSGISSVGSWGWNSDETAYECVVTPNYGSSAVVTLPTITVKSSLGTGSNFYAYAYGPGTTQHEVSTGKRYYLQVTSSYCYITTDNNTPTVGTNVVARVTSPASSGTVTAITSTTISATTVKESSITLGVSGTNLDTFAGDSTFSLAKTTYTPSGSSSSSYCVNLQHGNNVIGRISTQSVYNLGFSAGEGQFTQATVTPQGASAGTILKRKDSGSIRITGSRQQITKRGTAIYFKSHSKSDTPTGLWYEMIGSSSGATQTYYTSGDSLYVYPSGTSGGTLYYLSDGSDNTLRLPGTEDSTTYYTKTSS